MDGERLSDLLSKGLGVAARRIGGRHAVFRPNDATQPIGPGSHVVHLKAFFQPGGGISTGGAGCPGAVWSGTFDAAYTRPGDYLVGAGNTYFVGAQRSGFPPLCVQTNGTISLARPALPVPGGYAAASANVNTPLLIGWPAWRAWTAARIGGSLPERHFGHWVCLLPGLNLSRTVSPQVGDVLTDCAGNTFVLAAALATDIGWRLALTQVAG